MDTSLFTLRQACRYPLTRGNSNKQKVFVKLVEMAHELGIHTLAEGVETEGEYRWLAAQGVEYLQGYFFARPASPPPLSTPVLSEQMIPLTLPVTEDSAAHSLELALDSDALQGVLNSLPEQVAVIRPLA